MTVCTLSTVRRHDLPEPQDPKRPDSQDLSLIWFRTPDSAPPPERALTLGTPLSPIEESECGPRAAGDLSERSPW
jgi:hypothetical protein